MTAKKSKLGTPIGALKASVQKDKLVIEIPLDRLKFGIENNPEGPFKIQIRKAARYYADNILEHTSPQNVEGGLSDFENLLDAISLNAYESAEPWIKGPEDE